MIQRTFVAAMALVMCMAAGSVAAVEHGFYVGGALGQSYGAASSNGGNSTNSDPVFKLIVGVRPLKLLALEANYVDLGSLSTGGMDAQITAVDGFVLGFLPLPIVDIYGKLGLASWKAEASAPATSGSRNGTDLAFGAGFQLNLDALAIRLEYEVLEIQQASNPQFLTVGITYTFF